MAKNSLLHLLLALVVGSFMWSMWAFAKPAAPLAEAAACVPPPSGLISWWPGDGNADDIQNDNNGTLENGATFAPGQVGQGFSFDGVDDHVFIGNPQSLKFTDELTIDAWINPNDLSEGQIAAIVNKWGQSQSLDSYFFGITKQGGVIEVVGAIGVLGIKDVGLYGGNIPANTWSHVAMTYDNVTGANILYLNGQQAASRTKLGGIFASNQIVLIGREESHLPRPFPGLIDEVEIFDRALSPSEIQSIYDAGSAGKCKTTPVSAPASGLLGIVAMALAMAALLYFSHRRIAIAKLTVRR